MSESKMGNIPWNKGMPRSIETKEKISRANTGNKPTSTSFKKGETGGKNHYQAICYFPKVKICSIERQNAMQRLP